MFPSWRGAEMYWSQCQRAEKGSIRRQPARTCEAGRFRIRCSTVPRDQAQPDFVTARDPGDR